MSAAPRVTAGHRSPLGATLDGDGVNFAVFSRHATAMTLCLFDDAGNETLNVDLPERNGDVWHGHLAGIKPGQLYGYRAHGPYRPDKGHRFNPHKLLIDPYARRLTGHPAWHDALMGYEVGSPLKDLSYDRRDSAPYAAKSIVTDPSGFDWEGDDLLRTPTMMSVIYEGHVKGLTAGHPAAVPRGVFGGVACDAMLEHYTGLGITALELLPVHAFINDRFLIEKGLTNYWGYQSIGFFAPDPRYMERGDIAEFQGMVKRLHGAGIEVILDVVYNHSGEGNEMGPTLAFRGLDNASYYRLSGSDPRHYVNDTGTGNTLNIDDPMVLRMVMDSLRYWVEVMHVDGFRFDLCSVLGRTDEGFDPNAAFFKALRQDPVLCRVKLIAEPWDIGPGGYQLGNYPPPFKEWNDKFRDGVRRFWRREPGRVPDMAQRITGSARRFDHSFRPATTSVNFLSAHDGFTLADVVSYEARHNEANGEDGNDGHSENFSDNLGIEGPSADKNIREARDRRKRAMLATLMVSQGVPMVLAGDEIGNSQLGNNNAYNQDNPIGWINWEEPDAAFFAWVKKLIAFRKSHPILRQKRFLHSRERMIDGLEDLFWWREDGQPMQVADWDDPGRMILSAELRTASGTPEYSVREGALFVVLNAGDDAEVIVPAPPAGQRWRRDIDSAAPDAEQELVDGRTPVAGQSVVVLTLTQMAGEDPR